MQAQSSVGARAGPMRTRNDKYLHIAARLSQRIRAGDYHMQRLPAERDLALEVGVSHATARKALQKLLDDGLLVRLANGRLAVRRSDDPGASPVRPQIALLVPSWESSEVTMWNTALWQLADRYNFAIRLVHYAHLDDPLVLSSMEGFDGTFFLAVPEPQPANFMEKLVSLGRPVVVLANNWSEYGIPSLRLYPPVVVQKLCDHLFSLGHRRIDCFNVQPGADPLIAQWNLWRAGRGLEGELINEPVQAYSETLVAAYNVIAKRIREGRFDSKAIVCTQERVASGAMRAMADAGIRPGVDVAVCTIADALRAEYAIPSLTSLREPDPVPYLAVCLEWMLNKDRRWSGPMLVEPQAHEIAVRQSTVPDIDNASTSQRLKLSNP